MGRRQRRRSSSTTTSRSRRTSSPTSTRPSRPTSTSTFTQPLLRGFLIDNNRQQLRVTAINRDISEIQLRGTIATTLATVRNAYWELVYAHRGGRRGARVARRWPRSSSRTIARASRSARWRRSTSCRRRPKRRRGGRRSRRPRPRGAPRSSSLKRLIVNGTDDPLWRASINPIDRPTFAPEPLDVEGAVRKALREPDRPASRRGGRLDSQRRHAAASCATRRFPALDLIGQLRRAGARRHAVHPSGQRPRQHGHRHDSRRLFATRCGHADRPRLPDLELCR